MFYHLKIAIRNLRKNSLYSWINIGGLAVSLTAAIMIMLWVKSELSYDGFHRNAKSIYRVNFKMTEDIYSTNTTAPLAVHAKEENPEIVDFCRINKRNSPGVLMYEGKKIQNITGFGVDSSFFRMFDFPLMMGNRLEPFTDNESVIISESKAKIVFGDQDPMGQIIRLSNWGHFHVTGVMKDLPENSNFKADVIIKFIGDPNWAHSSGETYLQLIKDADSKFVADKIAKMYMRMRDIDFGHYFTLQPLTHIHLFLPNGQPEGMKTVRLLGMVAVLILVIACINYVNLVTARAGKRNKEIGMRKILGAGRVGLAGQLMRETALLLFAALLMSAVLVWLLLPVYNNLTGNVAEFSLFSSSTLQIYVVTALGVLALAGIYPAFFLSASFDAQTLKSGITSGKSRHGIFRKALVVLQFACSFGLIVSAVVIKNQLDYMQKKDLGYNKEQVFTMPALDYRTYNNQKAELMKNPNIIAVASCRENNLEITDRITGNWPGRDPNENIPVYFAHTTYDFIETMGIKLVAGENPPAAKKGEYILINEEAAKFLNLEVGSRFMESTIAGVVKDFNFEALNQPIKPLIINTSNERQSWIYIRTTATGAKSAVEHAAKLWKESGSHYDFTYGFLDDNFNKVYKAYIMTGKLFGIFSLIAILVSCLGLFGLITYTAETKTKEIGIRKVLGASVAGIVKILTKEFLILVVIAMFIAFPLAYYLLNRMLQDYAYRIDIGWWMFALAGIITVALTLLTVGWKAVKAATANPVKAIKTE